MGTNTEKPRMSPAEYREQLKKVELKSIFLDAFSVKTNRKKLGSGMKLDIRHRVGYSIEEENAAEVTINYDLLAAKSGKKDFALKIDCTYRVLLESEQPISDEFMEIFTGVNIHMNTWPYFRELVQTTIQRTGLPPLTLPFLKP